MDTVCGTLNVGVKLEIGVIVPIPQLDLEAGVPVGHHFGSSYSNLA